MVRLWTGESNEDDSERLGDANGSVASLSKELLLLLLLAVVNELRALRRLPEAARESHMLLIRLLLLLLCVSIAGAGVRRGRARARGAR